jgi:hypothetical protein
MLNNPRVGIRTLLSERGKARWAAKVTMMGSTKEKQAFESVTGP